MPTGTGVCPRCGVKFNARETSIGTVKKCEWCGHKFILRSAPVENGGSSCLSGLIAIFVGAGIASSILCGGILLFVLSRDVPAPKALPPQISDKTKGDSISRKPPVDLDALCGLDIDGVRKVLGKPEDGEYAEPSDLQKKLDFDWWDNRWHRDGHELLVTFDPRSRKVADFFIAGDDYDTIVRLWQLESTSKKYRLEAVKAIAYVGITGVKVIPLGSPARDQNQDSVIQAGKSQPTLPSTDGQNSSTRLWRSSTGTFKVRATLIAIDEKSVTLKKENGEVVEVEIEKLSDLDQRFANRERKKAEKK